MPIGRGERLGGWSRPVDCHRWRDGVGGLGWPMN
jgi:hypothetical protein